MGYCIYVRNSSFGIDAKHKGVVMERLHSWAIKGERKSWVSNSVMTNRLEKGDIDGMFEELGWPVEFDDDGNIVGIMFERNKAGDEEGWLEAIEKYVTDKSYIEVQGEDGAQWRWYFTEGELKTDDAEIVWESDEELGL